MLDQLLGNSQMRSCLGTAFTMGYFHPELTSWRIVQVHSKYHLLLIVASLVMLDCCSFLLATSSTGYQAEAKRYFFDLNANNFFRRSSAVMMSPNSGLAYDEANRCEQFRIQPSKQDHLQHHMVPFAVLGGRNSTLVPSPVAIPRAEFESTLPKSIII